MSNDPPPPYPGGPTAPLLEEKSGAPPTPGRVPCPCQLLGAAPGAAPLPTTKPLRFPPHPPPRPGRTSPAVMQPPPGMSLPPADIGPPPYEPPGHPTPQPGFIPPHVNADGTYMPPGKTERNLV